MGQQTFLVLVLSLLFIGPTALAQSQDPDELTRQLFEQYIAKPGKIDTDSVMAATQLVTTRGRTTGFWKEILAELQRDNEHNEVGCVRVLGKMLAIDDAARDAIRRRDQFGEVSAWIPSVSLDDEVVTILIERGEKADRFKIDHYVIALMRSRSPKAMPFFQEVLGLTKSTSNSHTEPTYYLPSTQYHAAVGLSQLGDLQGLNWLIANCEDIQGTVSNAWPRGIASGGSLGPCCVAALQQISNNRSFVSKAQWQSWQKTVNLKTLPNYSVVFGDP